MSLCRSIKRRQLRKNGIGFVGKPQPTVSEKDGSYSTLHPTRGWQRFSVKRLRARGLVK